MENKTCCTCKIEKSINSFNINKTRKDGYNCSCKECSAISFKQWADSNKESLKDRKKTYRQENKEHVSKLVKERRINGGYEKDKKYYQKNKAVINKKQNERYKKRKETDPLFKLKCRIISNISTYIKRNGYSKKNKTNKILGCTFEEFKYHLESQWKPWMNWDNYGNPKDGIYAPNKTWDIDHIIPTSSAITEEDLLKLNHFTNLQPLCSYFNRFIKSDSMSLLEYP